MDSFSTCQQLRSVVIYHHYLLSMQETTSKPDTSNIIPKECCYIPFPSHFAGFFLLEMKKELQRKFVWPPAVISRNWIEAFYFLPSIQSLISSKVQHHHQRRPQFTLVWKRNIVAFLRSSSTAPIIVAIHGKRTNAFNYVFYEFFAINIQRRSYLFLLLYRLPSPIIVRHPSKPLKF